MLSAYWSTAQKTGMLTGYISDPTGYLPGANVVLMGSNQGTATDLNGGFQLGGVPAGKQKVVITFMGYEDRVVDWEVKEGINDLGVISLTDINNNLREVVVKSTMAPSQIKAMSIKKNSYAIMEVMAADAIGKLPDRNAAEAVQRMQGVAVARYHGEADQATVRGTPFAWTSTLFNGTRMPSANVYGSRNSILDAVPSEMIQYVQLAKAITPDMEGDAIGGSINFVMRTAPEHRVLNISAAGGYNQRSKDGTYNASIVYGDRFFKDKLGVMVAASIWDRNWATDELALTYNTSLPDPVQKYSVNTMLAKRYMGKRKTYGINAGLEYRFNAAHRLYTRLLIDKFDDVRPVYESYYDFNNSRYQVNYRFSEYQSPLNGIELGGEHQLSDKLKVDWLASNYVSKFFIDTPPTLDKSLRGLPIATFRQKLAGGFGKLSSDGRKYLHFDAPDGVGDEAESIKPYLTNPEDLLDPSKLSLQQLVVIQLDTKEHDKTGQMNLTWNANSRLILKVGGKYRSKIRESHNQTVQVWLPGAAVGIPNSPSLVPMSSMQTTDFPVSGNFFNEIGAPFNNLIVNPITKNQLFDTFSPEFLDENGFHNFSSASNPTTIYDGSENVLAGYIMGIYDLTDKLKVIGGLRNEFTKLTMNGSQYLAQEKKIVALKAENNYNALLPMLHFKYAINDKSNIRAAYTRTFIRPNFPDLNPGESVDVTKTPGVITRGNANLKPTFSNNFDLMGEYFFSTIGLISGGVFYKDISDVIFSDVSNESINGNNFIVTQPKNLRKARLVGFEAGITRRFRNLPGILSGLGVEFNYTRIDSQVEVPRSVDESTTTMDKTRLPNQSKDMFNAILFYERNGLMMRVAGNFRGTSVEAINQQLGPDFYTHSGKNFTVDFSGAYAITPKLRFFVEINNLTNQPLVMYLGNDSRRLTSKEWYSIRGQAGLRWNLF
ncbi:TonB-dependent receptor [Dyadobacter jejuensis]|uniref:TonB-dependent receptor n=2 Tax=Dyadobacter jejuensis TaxID=1082580 RepID=A0A316AQY0_9BACT|nr:TonB-dependent receptor [Dyadobacter jejuensis]